MLNIFLLTTLALSNMAAEMAETTPAKTEQAVVYAPEVTPEPENAIIVAASTTTQQAETAITLTNAITPEMLNYKHWTGTYSPDNFTVSVNGKALASGESCTVNANNFDITYQYSFVNGYRTGTETVSYTMNENNSTGILTFSWNNKPSHLCVDNAQPQNMKKT